jgi:hypothetical protein
MRDLEKYSRNMRNENRVNVSVGTGEPNKNEGNEGDIRINSTHWGVILYAKYKNEWYSVGLTKLLNIPKKISMIGTPTTRFSSIKPRKSVSYFHPDINEYPEIRGTFEWSVATIASKINEIIERIQ